MEEAYCKLLNDILRGYDRCTPTKIVTLRNNQLFVFGTDCKGSQKHGAAGLAAKSFGAKVGVVDGPTGMCYALPTMGFTEQDLTNAVERFEQYVRTNMKYTYLVTAVGCGHARFDVTKVANMFKGLTCVGLDRPAWNAMRGNPITDADGTVIAYEGAEPQYTHTIDPRKSELYGGQQQTFIAPYNRCDRIADYRTAWAHFEKIFS